MDVRVLTAVIRYADHAVLGSSGLVSHAALLRQLDALRHHLVVRTVLLGSCPVLARPIPVATGGVARPLEYAQAWARLTGEEPSRPSTTRVETTCQALRLMAWMLWP